MAADQGGPHGDLYRVLGVPREASREDIAQAWRRRARAEHPDTRPRDAAAPGRFRALAEAYRVLGDPARRAAYDRALGADPRAAEAADGLVSPGPVSPGRTSPGPAPRTAGVGVPVHVTVVRRPEPPLRAGPVWVEAPSPGRDAEPRAADMRAMDAQTPDAEAEAADAEARTAMLAELAMRYLSGHYRYRRWGRS